MGKRSPQAASSKPQSIHQLTSPQAFSTFTVSKFLPWKVTSVSWFMGMTKGLGARNWGQLSSWERAKLVR